MGVKTGMRKALCLTLACAVVACAGCGQDEEPQEGRPEDVTLLEPVGVTANYETVVRRNLYDVQVLPAVICPYTEEYQLRESVRFDAYDALPGDYVKKGQALLHGDQEDGKEQIEKLQEDMEEAEKEYLEFLQENEEQLSENREQEEYWGGIMEIWEKEKPQQYITETVTDEEGNESEVSVPNPAFYEWLDGTSSVWGMHTYESKYRNALQKVLELEEARKERMELYELDSQYQQLQISRLQEDIQGGILSSGMNGYVAAFPYASSGNWLSANQSLMAVCDPDRVELRCQYISKPVVDAAEDVYALVDGKRYEVLHKPAADSAEYDRLAVLYGTVPGVFEVTSDTEGLEMGGYAVVVVKKKTRENVLAVPKDAIETEDRVSYVYVIGDGVNVRTEVTLGMSDGRYTEVLSGLKEGDRVRTEQAITAGEGTVKVARGAVSNTFKGQSTIYYVSTEWIENPVEYGTVYLEELLAGIHVQVKKGDVLARIRVVPDQAEIDRNERKLVREQARLQDMLLEKPDGGDALKSWEKSVESKEESIHDLEELLNDMKADAAVTEVTAPRDGIVTSYGNVIYNHFDRNTFSYGSNYIIEKGAELFQFADDDQIYLNVADEDGQLAYGNQVLFTYKEEYNSTEEKQATGRVVTVNPMCLTIPLQYSGVMVKLESGDIESIIQSDRWIMTMSGEWMGGGPTASVQIRSVDDVLLVPKKAVTTIGNNTYVKVRLENGEVQYRSFISGGGDNNNYWVVDGLTEGMELCLD